MGRKPPPPTSKPDAAVRATAPTTDAPPPRTTRAPRRVATPALPCHRTPIQKIRRRSATPSVPSKDPTAASPPPTRSEARGAPSTATPPPPLSSDPTFPRVAPTATSPPRSKTTANSPVTTTATHQPPRAPPPTATTVVTTTAVPPTLPLVVAFSAEKPTTTSKSPPAAEQIDPPRSSSPTISSGFSSSSQSPGASPPQRSRLGKGKSVLPPSSKLGGFTTFKSKVQQTRYYELCRYPIIAGKYVDYDALNALNICDEFVALVDGIGWGGYFHVKLPAFIELTREFYTTFKFNKTKDLTLTSPGVVKFRLMGKEFSYSINQFNVALGFVDNDYVQTDEKDSSGTFTKAEFYFIWCMQNKIKANLGIWLATQFQSASNKKRLILGSYITQLAVSLKLLDSSNTNMHIACHMEPLDIDCLHRMGIVTLKHGRPTFTSPGPTVQPKKRKCRDMEEPSRDTTSSTPETSNMHSFSRQFEDRLNRIESKLDRILAHFHIPPD
ncbi:hypothetical protein BUALT_Bualt14G0073200 [Buddleja alternifolia]|uniref:Uncharacterized protein n=1 Tax=Buddleja alternifolia TaxID=168488 RepID=A0AAV6WHM3_9LAMI|nr:hypothetical protein BUALT_Bualt14G0073200 [Buddleja alternifolia]